MKVPPSSFEPHTYLVKIPVLKKTGNYDSSPALHSAEASVIEWPSGPSFAQFLMVYLYPKRPVFTSIVA